MVQSYTNMVKNGETVVKMPKWEMCMLLPWPQYSHKLGDKLQCMEQFIPTKTIGSLLPNIHVDQMDFMSKFSIDVPSVYKKFGEITGFGYNCYM